MDRVGGFIGLGVNGEHYSTKGHATYNLGKPKRKEVLNSDGTIDFMEEPQVPYIEVSITDRKSLDLEALTTVRDATVVLELANGKAIVLREACYAAEGEVNTEEGEIKARFVGRSAEEIK